MGENIITISILAKSRSVAPVKLEINLVSPNPTYNISGVNLEYLNQAR